MTAWPRSRAYSERFCVADLLPHHTSAARVLFIGESPHRDEVAPPSVEERSPFRGVAGREWWTELAKFQRHPARTRPVPPREELERICDELKIAVMNAVQFPLDPKILLHQKASPVAELGFEKSTGPTGYKAIYRQDGLANPVALALADLASRLWRFADAEAQIVCLGHDSRWFVDRAIAHLPPEAALREKPLLTVPHPSSWWRNASYRARAVKVLEESLGARTRAA